jgi:putative mRNA 3-end processing factor
MRNDLSATLVQVAAGDGTPVSSARCTTYDFRVVAHPTEETVDTLVEDLDPTQVIVIHQRGRGARRYRDNTFVWATDDNQQYTIFEDDEWVGPSWMTAEGREYVWRNNQSRFRTWLGDSFDGDDPIPLPACERVTESVDLDAKGLDVDAIERRLHVSESASEADTTTPSAANATESGAPTGEEGDTDEAPSETLASITARLDAVEAQLNGTALPARVIDAGSVEVDSVDSGSVEVSLLTEVGLSPVT